MTSEQFDRLVNRIQAKFGSRPLRLRLRLVVLVVLGYLGFLAILLAMLALSVMLIAAAVSSGKEPGILLMAAVAVLLAFGISQALIFLWVPMKSAPAREVTRDEAPRLFELLDSVQAKLGVAPFNHVRITSEYNASVQMIPRLGAFGFNRKYLYLGLPMMQTLSPEHYASVLAHEFAHYSSRHDRFGMWIYRLRQTWTRVFAELHDKNSVGGVKSLRSAILWFVDWYWPRFNAHAFVLSRENEYEADRVAGDWAGAECAAEALFRTECVGIRISDKFWTDVTLQARSEAQVPDDIVERMRAYLLQPPAPEDAARWLDQAAQTLTGNIDTHPSLSDRLKSLDQEVAAFVRRGFPSIPSYSAADALLADALPRVTGDVNQQWKKENTLRWQNVYNQARRIEKDLGPTPSAETNTAEVTASDQVVAATFDIDQAWLRVRAVWDLQGASAAEPLLRQLLEHRPAHLPANVTLGRHLLERGLPEGELFLRRVLEEDDSDLIPSACQGLIQYFQQQGQLEKVNEARSHLSRFETAQEAAAKERSQVTASDRFVPHGLSDQELAALFAIFSEERELHTVWLVRKDLKHFRKQRLFILVARSLPSGFFRNTNADADRILVARLLAQVKLPGRVLVIPPQGGFRRLAKKIMSLPDSEIFSS